MQDVIQKLLSLLGRKERLLAFVLMGLLIVNAFVQAGGILSIMPFLSVLSEPEVIHRNEWLSWAYETLGFQSEDAFLYALGGGAFFFIVVGNAVQAFTQWVTFRFTHMRQYSVSRRLMGDYLRRPYTFFVNRNSSDLSKTVLTESNHVVNGALMPALKLVSNTLLAVVIVGVLIAVDPALAFLMAGLIGGIYLAVYLLAKTWLRRLGEERVVANEQRFSAVSEAFAGAKEIRLLGRERVYLNRYQRAARTYANNQAKQKIFSDLPQYVIEAVAFGGIVLMLLFMMRADAGLSAALPVVGLYAMAGKRLIPAFKQVFSAFAALRFNMPAVDNFLQDYGEQSDSTPLPDPRQVAEPLVPHQAIYFENLSYRYPDSDRLALDSITLTIPANTTVGLVGASGAGKSTLVDVLLGLLEPESGKLWIDGDALDSSSVRNWQASIGYVPQHIFLADDTVAGNIALGEPSREVDRARVAQAAKMANLHEFVTHELPHGYDTEIGERGVRLSGGQRQRIGIARALYRDPAVLVFDEATSALDNATERVVMEAVHNLAAQKTIIMVAHRLSTVKPCDKIFVLQAGRVVEQGRWAELVEREEGCLRKLAAGWG